MAKRKAKDDAPVISVRALVYMHVVMLIVVALLAWLDWSLPN
ncbi:hypothetical protein [Acetobacter sacchari]|nr:hypothetical protein [Acetobacter sacchari]